MPPLPTPAASLSRVADGVEALRLPLPFALDHVTLWLLADGDGWVLIDSGLGSAEIAALWEHLLATELAGRRFTRMICTHFHPDHMGLAGWLGPRLGVALTASQGEWAEARRGWFATGPEPVEIKLAHYRRMGFGEERLAAMRAGGNIFRSPLAPPPETFIAIADGDTLRIDGKDWQVMTFGGHSPEHVCLWCPERSLLIAGDQILPTISPVVGVWPDSPDADPLGLFLGGLDRLRRLPADTLVLPAHGAPFHGLQARCDALIHHHHDRLETIASACDSPATVFDILGTVFSRPLDVHQMGFAGAEILAHLNPLVADGRLVRDSRDGGPWTFARA